MAQFGAQAVMRGLKERLDISLGGESYVESYDSNGFPILVVSKGAEKLFLKIETIEQTPGRVDGLGLAQRVYSPHKAVLIQEAATALVVPTASELETRYKMLAQAAKLGMKVEVFEGVGVRSAADFAAALALGTKVVELKSHEIHPMTLSV